MMMPFLNILIFVQFIVEVCSFFCMICVLWASIVYIPVFFLRFQASHLMGRLRGERSISLLLFCGRHWILPRIY